MFVLIIATSCNRPPLVTLSEGVDQSAGNLSCYIIKTPTAIYYLEKTGAGLSSLLDLDGNDWLSFHPDPGSGAGGEYRGFPNAIHQQDGSFFHPLNAGTDSSSTEIESITPDKITILARSGNGTWEAGWAFYPTHCTFTMLKMPSDFKYWILYEGTPGGRYDDDDWWMTSAVAEKTPLTTNHEGDIPAPEWIAFGDQNLNRSLVLYHHEDDNFEDRFYQMEKKMSVFGFGRLGLEKYLANTPQSFSIGFVESTEHSAVSKAIETIIEP